MSISIRTAPTPHYVSVAAAELALPDEINPADATTTNDQNAVAVAKSVAPCIPPAPPRVNTCPPTDIITGSTTPETATDNTSPDSTDTSAPDTGLSDTSTPSDATDTSTTEIAAPSPPPENDITGTQLQIWKQSHVPPKVTIAISPDWSNYVVTKNRVAVGQIPVPSPGLGNQPSVLGVYKQTDRYAYFLAGAATLYRLNLLTNMFRNITPDNAATVEDISSDDSMVAWTVTTGASEVLITHPNRGSSNDIAIPVDVAYQDFGDARFSPDNKKIAFSAARDNPLHNDGVVFLYNLASRQLLRRITTTRQDGYFRVLGWFDANDVNYQSHFITEEYDQPDVYSSDLVK